MKYQIQILVDTPEGKKEWKSIRPSGPRARPYEYENELEAHRMLRMCYGSTLCSNEMRVINTKDL
jgi:hypothetical protein